jgi:acid stress-induced BolA-like protein IbaG/YrbA
MIETEIQTLLSAKIPDAQVEVQVNGNSFMLQVVSDAFDDLRAIKRQQLVYSCIDEKIKSGEMHAVTMRLFSLAEWEKQKKFSL